MHDFHGSVTQNIEIKQRSAEGQRRKIIFILWSFPFTALAQLCVVIVLRLMWAVLYVYIDQNLCVFTVEHWGTLLMIHSNCMCRYHSTTIVLKNNSIPHLTGQSGCESEEISLKTIAHWQFWVSYVKAFIYTLTEVSKLQNNIVSSCVSRRGISVIMLCLQIWWQIVFAATFF